MNKNIVIAILAIIIIAAVGVSAYTMMQHGKTTENGKINTSIQFLSNDTLKNGDQVAFIVKDAQGTPVANKEVKIIYTEDGKNQTYSIKTGNDGKGFLVLKDEKAGKHDITVSFAGDNKYNGCTAKKTITIEEGQSNAKTSTATNSTASTVQYNNNNKGSSSSGSSSNPLYYDSEHNLVYDSNGKIIGGQNAGQDAFEVISTLEYQKSLDNGNGLQ